VDDGEEDFNTNLAIRISPVNNVCKLAGRDNQLTDPTGANSLPSSGVAGSTPHTSGGRHFTRNTKLTKGNKNPSTGKPR